MHNAFQGLQGNLCISEKSNDSWVLTKLPPKERRRSRLATKSMFLAQHASSGAKGEVRNRKKLFLESFSWEKYFPENVPLRNHLSSR